MNFILLEKKKKVKILKNLTTKIIKLHLFEKNFVEKYIEKKKKIKKTIEIKLIN